MSESLNHSLNKSFKNTDSFNYKTPLCNYFVGEAKLDDVFCPKCKFLNIKVFFVELYKTKTTLATHAKAVRAVIKFRRIFLNQIWFIKDDKKHAVLELQRSNRGLDNRERGKICIWTVNYSEGCNTLPQCQRSLVSARPSFVSAQHRLPIMS